MTPMVWNIINNEKLLIFLLASNPRIKLDFEGAARMLTNKEQTCTARAVQEHFKKMKRIVGEDPKWAIKAEQAAQGHGSRLNTGAAANDDSDGDNDSDEPVVTLKTTRSAAKSTAQATPKGKAKATGTPESSAQPKQKKQKIGR